MPMQQGEHHPGGRRQVYHHVLQEGSWGLILDLQAHQEEPRMSEEMLTITNKYALVEEATLDTREQKKEKESGHSDQHISSKGHDKKRKVGCSMNNMERL
jgi:hypothetical protein